MFAEFESVHNYHEKAVFRQVMESAAGYPKFSDDLELLADVACLALNRLPARYIRNQVDMNFFMSHQDRSKLDVAVKEAVEFAFRFMQSRAALPARE